MEVDQNSVPFIKMSDLNNEADSPLGKPDVTVGHRASSHSRIFRNADARCQTTADELKEEGLDVGLLATA